MKNSPHIPPLPTELNFLFRFFSFWAHSFRYFFTSTLQKTVFANYNYDEIRNFGSYLYLSTTGYTVTPTLMETYSTSVDMHRYHYLPLHKQYELSNHLGNVLVTLSAKPIFVDSTQNNIVDYRMADVMSISDYYPFGMLAPGRHWQSDSYRFGYQAQEAENELLGLGNASFFKHRISDNRIGRFFAVDPLASEYPFYSPYAFSGNRVIDMVEQEGLQPAKANVHLDLKHNVNTNETIIHGIRKIVPIEGGEQYDVYRVIQTTHKFIGEAWHSSETKILYVPANETINLIDELQTGINEPEDNFLDGYILLPVVTITELEDKGKGAIEEVAPGITKGDISKYIQEYIKIEDSDEKD